MRPGTSIRETVIVVHDDLSLLRYLTDGLERAGLTVLIATSAADAHILLRQVSPKAILTHDRFQGIGADRMHSSARGELSPVPVIHTSLFGDTGVISLSAPDGSSDMNMLLAHVRYRIIAAELERLDGETALPDATDALLWVDEEDRLIWADERARQLLAAKPFGWFQGHTAPAPLRDIFQRPEPWAPGASEEASYRFGDLTLQVLGEFPNNAGLLAHISRSD